MLKKILYNKYKIENIPKTLDMNSEEIFKVLFDFKNVVLFKYKDGHRLLKYNGVGQDYLGRAEKYQPFSLAGGEVYPVLSKKDVELYEENSLRTCGSHYNFISDDIDDYIFMLSTLEKAIVLNSKQVWLPFIAKTKGSRQADLLKKMLSNIFGEDFKNMVVETNITEDQKGTTIETTNMQVLTEQLQNTKKKILDEAFLYLGVSAPAGKLTHQSEIEIQEQSEVPDLIDNIVFAKIGEFIERCNQHFGFSMKLVKRF